MTTTISFRATISLSWDFATVVKGYDDQYGADWQDGELTGDETADKQGWDDEEKAQFVKEHKKTKLYKKTKKELRQMAEASRKTSDFYSNKGEKPSCVYLPFLWGFNVQQKNEGVTVTHEEKGDESEMEFWIDAPNKKALLRAIKDLKKEIKDSSLFLYCAELGEDMTDQIDS